MYIYICVCSYSYNKSNNSKSSKHVLANKNNYLDFKKKRRFSFTSLSFSLLLV